MRILVTGSEGFIGRNLIAELKSKHDIVAFDTKINRIEEFYEDVDVSSIDHIFHLGAISSTLETDIQKLYKHNVEFSIDLFNVAIDWKIPITYTSSASIFGNTMKSDQYIYNPLNYYATTKMLTEMWMWDNRIKFNFFSVPRLFNVYGANEQKSDMSTSPICKFTQQAKTDGVIKVFKGSENMIRDFVCIEDVVWVLTNSLHKTRSGFYDVGTTKPVSFLQVAQMIADKYDASIKFVDMPDYMKPSYQYYTKARDNTILFNTSVEDWLNHRS